MGWRRLLPARRGDGRTRNTLGQSKGQLSKSLTVLKDVNSVDSKHERVRGVGNIRQTETLLIVSQNQITVPPVKYQTYPGGK